MSDKLLSILQSVYYIVGIVCSIFAILLQWNKHLRDKNITQPDSQRNTQELKNFVHNQVAKTLCEHMIPIRRLYIDSVSDEERLRTEVSIIFDRPGVQQTFSKLYYQLFEYESYVRKKRYSRYARTVAVISVLLSLPFVVFPWIEVVQGNAMNYDPVDWIMLVILLEAITTLAFTTIYIRRIDHRLADIKTRYLR